MWSSPRIARTATVAASLIALSASGITMTARALGLHKMDTNMKSEPTGPCMPDPTPLSPSHYQWHPVCEAQEISGHFPHHLGAAIDYIWRVGRKDDPIQDINKAIRHLEFERARLIGSAQTVSGTATVPSFEQDDSSENEHRP